MAKTGFIGLGIMGKPMAKNLLAGGMDLLVHDLNEGAVAELVAQGAKKAGPEEIGASCPVIFTILPNGPIVQSVLFGPGGVSAKIARGAIVCDMSSVTPQESRQCHEKLGGMGVGFVDAPVSGGEPGAINGTLAFMAGGDQKDFDALRPYFDIMGSSAILVGPSGSGSVTKLANQMIVNLTIASVSEAFTLAVKAGADPQKVYEAIRGGLAGSAVLDAKVPMMIRRDFRPGGKISINHKDIKNVLASAHAIDAPVFLSSVLFEILQALKVGGHMDEDHSAIVKFFERNAAVEVTGKS
ncbi:MAG: NAD-binding protein [Desulfovibrionaceae bacterium]|nr:NAD-binding protein [Desulfovibrionaceae bacterium]